MFITDTVQEAINNGGTKIDLNTVPVQQTEVPIAPQTNRLYLLHRLSCNVFPSPSGEVNTSDTSANQSALTRTPVSLLKVMPASGAANPAR